MAVCGGWSGQDIIVTQLEEDSQDSSMRLPCQPYLCYLNEEAQSSELAVAPVC